MLWKPTIRWPRRYSPWWIAAYSVGAGLAALAVIIFSVSGLVGGFIAGVAFAAVFELLDRAFTSLGTPPRSSKD